MTEREVNQSELTTRNLEAVSDALSAEAAAAQGGNQSPRGRKAYYRVPSYESSDTGDHTRRVSLDSGFDSSVTAHARKLEHNERVLSVQPEGLKGLDRKTLRSEQSIDTFVNLKGCLQWLNHSQELKEGRLEDDDDEDAVDSPLCVVHPEGRFRAGWDVMISIFMMYLSWIVPFRVGVLTAEEDQRFQDDHRSLSGFDILVDFIFLLDIIIQFRTAYFDRSEQRWQWATKEMALHYAKRTFVLDVIATVPFVARGLIGVEDVSLGQRFGGRLFRLLKLFHIPRVMKASKRLGYLYHLWVHYIGKTEGLGRLLWWLSVMLLLTHWIACGFVLIGDPNGNDPTCVEFDVPPDRCSWLEINQVYLRGIDYRYFIAVHWAVQTLTTVGYGNVSINTITEFIYQSIMMVVGVSWYAYVVSAAATAIRSFDIRNDLIRERMRAVNDFIADSGFPSALATSVRNHFKHIYALEAEETTRRADYDRVEIIQELPQYLLRRVMASLAAPTLKALPQLEILSDSALVELILLMQPIRAQPGEVILREDSRGQDMYFLVHGKVQVMRHGHRVCSLHKGAYFGEQACLPIALAWSIYRDLRGSATPSDVSGESPADDYESTKRAADLLVTATDRANAEKAKTHRKVSHNKGAENTTSVRSTESQGTGVSSLSEVDMPDPLRPVSPLDGDLTETSESSVPSGSLARSHGWASLRNIQWSSSETEDGPGTGGVKAMARSLSTRGLGSPGKPTSSPNAKKQKINQATIEKTKKHLAETKKRAEFMDLSENRHLKIDALQQATRIVHDEPEEHPADRRTSTIIAAANCDLLRLDRHSVMKLCSLHVEFLELVCRSAREHYDLQHKLLSHRLRHHVPAAALARHPALTAPHHRKKGNGFFFRRTRSDLTGAAGPLSPSSPNLLPEVKETEPNHAGHPLHPSEDVLEHLRADLSSSPEAGSSSHDTTKELIEAAARLQNAKTRSEYLRASSLESNDDNADEDDDGPFGAHDAAGTSARLLSSDSSEEIGLTLSARSSRPLLADQGEAKEQAAERGDSEESGSPDDSSGERPTLGFLHHFTDATKGDDSS
uniref:Cyclic nucleotide-binding domain-containing protein n=1 Tax=Pinguiococcus pyrenoidosus TaxID=172671 RepID=A0A7R9UEX9_9STRA|mmetsp:Transcript_8034/g.30113  ORF Transcript_8034/g.30113 Transcript_8034/m.30113 type:complete len:1071 (+) Transcript_8034:264-3476(+)